MAKHKVTAPPKQATLKLFISYDGTNYAGWQIQPHRTTVQGTVESALQEFFKRRINLHGSGRTDLGVHAREQIASCIVHTSHTPKTLVRALNAVLPEDIRVNKITIAKLGFHARLSAKAKTYRYQIDCGNIADPFLRMYALHHPYPLNMAAMHRAAKVFIGSHDFSAFSANSRRKVNSKIREIKRISFRKEERILTISITANGFLYKMARSLVGGLLKVGESKLSVDDLETLLEKRKRTPKILTAPAHGLYLWKVYY